MKLKELIKVVRQRAKDVDNVKPLWQDPDIVTLLNDGQWEACRRSRLLKDSTTPEVCRIDISANLVTYPVDPRVMFIRRVKLNSRARPLDFKRVRDMDEEFPGWEAHTGQITHWVPDYSTEQLRLYRLCDATTTLPDFAMLTVVRGPLNDMVNSEDVPEINPRFHYNLHHWALYRMFSDQDAETYDANAAAKALDAFEAEFGPPSTAREEVWLEENIDFAEDTGVY